MRCEISVSPREISGPHAHTSWLDRESRAWLFITNVEFHQISRGLWSGDLLATVRDVFLRTCIRNIFLSHYSHIHTMRPEHGAFISFRELKNWQGWNKWKRVQREWEAAPISADRGADMRLGKIQKLFEAFGLTRQLALVQKQRERTIASELGSCVSYNSWLLQG